MTTSPTCDRRGPVTAVSRLVRAAAIAGLGAGILWFGHRFAPVPEARATVYETLGSELAGVPPFMEFRVPQDQVQTAVLNGGRIYYTRTTTERRIGDVLDFYETMYAMPKGEWPPEGEPRSRLFKEMRRKNPELADAIPQLHRLIARNAFRAERETWGMYGAVRAGDEGERDYADRALKRLTRFAETGRIGDLGDVKVVYAVRPRGESRTTVFTFWPDPDTNIRSLSLPERGDAPGSDIPGLPRPPDSRRLVSFGQDMPGVSFRIALYEEEEDRDAAAAAWSARLRAAGWREDPRVRGRTETSAHGTGLFFVRLGQEAFVQVRDATRSGRTVSTAIVSRRAP